MTVQGAGLRKSFPGHCSQLWAPRGRDRTHPWVRAEKIPHTEILPLSLGRNSPWVPELHELKEKRGRTHQDLGRKGRWMKSRWVHEVLLVLVALFISFAGCSLSQFTARKHLNPFSCIKQLQLVFGGGFRACFEHKAPLCTGRVWKPALSALLVHKITDLLNPGEEREKCLESIDKQCPALFWIKMSTKRAAALEIQWLGLRWAVVPGWYHCQQEKKWERTAQKRFPSSTTSSSETEKLKLHMGFILFLQQFIILTYTYIYIKKYYTLYK